MHYIATILHMTMNWNKVFVMCSKVEGVDFVTMLYSMLLNAGKSELKMMKTLWKNSPIIAKDVWIIYVNFIVIAITFSEKKTGGFTFVLPLVHNALFITDTDILIPYLLTHHFFLVYWQEYEYSFCGNRKLSRFFLALCSRFTFHVKFIDTLAALV
jgi:hypothetical protein